MTTSLNGKTMQSEINVTPMIDVLLVLLIIFMVIVPALPRGESAALPKAAHGNRSVETAVVVEVLKGSRGEATYRINQHAVAREDLAGRLTEIYAGRGDRVLFVKADDQLSFTEIAQVIDIGHSAGADRVGLITPGTAGGL
jgi:biopolymer transport protein ExbD